MVAGVAKVVGKIKSKSDAGAFAPGTKRRAAYRSSSSVIPFKITFSCRGERPFARRGEGLSQTQSRKKVFGLLTQANRIRQGSPLAVHRPKIRARALRSVSTFD